jgi:hypothetical protein
MAVGLSALTYRVRRGGGGEQENVAESVRIVRVPCPFGGTRPYFTCPAFGRRVAKLAPTHHFLRRHCGGLVHASQSESARDRALRRATKIRRRLSGEPSVAAPFPPKSKGMWERTYARLQERAVEAEMRAEEAFAEEAERLSARINKTYRKGLKSSPARERRPLPSIAYRRAPQE